MRNPFAFVPTFALVLALTGCATENVAPVIVGTAGAADTALGDGGLGDGASATGDGQVTPGPGADGQTSGTDGQIAATDSATGGETAVLTDGSIADGTAVGPDGVQPVTDAPPPADGTGGPETSVTPDIAMDSAQPDGAVAKYQLCSQLLTCVWVACGGTPDPKCAEPCLGVASASATAGVTPYLDCVKNYCINGKCAGTPTAQCMNDCVGQKCMFTVIGCGADGKTGTEPCFTAFDCLEACKEKGAECSYACYSKLTKAAQNQLDALFNCANASGGSDPFAACPSQAYTCIAGGKSGSGGCSTLWVCMDSCNGLPEGDKVGCLGNCWGAASASAQKQWIDISKCLASPVAPCGQTLATCAEPKGTKTCLDALGCWDACEKAQKKADCHLGCLSAASPVEATKVGNLLVCMGSQCKACNGDKTCEGDCVKAKCKTEFEGCLK